MERRTFPAATLLSWLTAPGFVLYELYCSPIKYAWWQWEAHWIHKWADYYSHTHGDSDKSLDLFTAPQEERPLLNNSPIDLDPDEHYFSKQPNSYKSRA